jgi:parallel beta-helix repeat protein
VNTYATSWISSNTTIACGTGATFHSTVPLTCYGAPGPLVSHGSSNVTIEGCTFTGIYTPSMAAQGQALCPGWISGGGDPVAFYSGSNIIFTDNAVTNQFAGEGAAFSGSSNLTVSNNYFADNYQQGLQLSDCKNCNVTGNYSLDSGFDIEDSRPQPSGYDIETWSNNTFACDGTDTQGQLSGAFGAWACGAKCLWNAAGCSAAANACTPGQYKNVVVKNNTITGPGSVLLDGLRVAPTLVSNTFANGGLLCPR